MTRLSFARQERLALCDLAAELGATAPTLCGTWTAKDLVVHLLVRERSLVGAPGIVLPPLAGLTKWSMDRVGRAEFADLVDRLRSPGLTPAAIPAVDRVLNTLEFFVHHEDLRRAQPHWAPRELPESAQSVLWRAVSTAGKAFVRKTGLSVELRRSDTKESAVLVSGDDPVIVEGLPAELVMFLFGRDQHRGLEFFGTPNRVERLRVANLGI